MKMTLRIGNPPRHLRRISAFSAASAASHLHRRPVCHNCVPLSKTRAVSRSLRFKDLRLVGAVVDNRETTKAPTEDKMEIADIGLVGLAVMGQNFALNIAEKGFKISVFNRTYSKTEATIERASKEKLDENLSGYEDLAAFVASLKKPRKVIILVQAGPAVDSTIENLIANGIEKDDLIIDGGNEWFEKTEERMRRLEEQGIYYIGMGISGGEEGARNGPSLMPGGEEKAYKYVEPILQKVAAQVDSGPCVAYIGREGAGNFVKMVHNGIEYGEMQLIAEVYDCLKTMGGMNNDEIAAVFDSWNRTELKSFLLEISPTILRKKDDDPDADGEGYLLDQIYDIVGSKGTGKWTVQHAAELGVSAPTIATALDCRYQASRKDARIKASSYYRERGLPQPVAMEGLKREELISEMRNAYYCGKICVYTQGLAIMIEQSKVRNWNLEMGTLARIWKGGCIIRGSILDKIRDAFYINFGQENLLIDSRFMQSMLTKSPSLRKVVKWSIDTGMALPAISSSLAYFDSVRRLDSPANLIQAQRDFFGSHTYKRRDKKGDFHTIWDPNFASADSATTSGYIA